MFLNENYEKIKAQIRDCCRKTDRNVEEVTLVAVTKTFTAEDALAAIRSGLQNIGENKIQEAEAKLPLLSLPYRFHFIGRLQSNKINKLLALQPELLHSLDKISTAEKLNEALAYREKKQNILIQVNTSGETSKAGIAPSELVPFAKTILTLPHLELKGLMTIGALDPNPQKTRDCFRLLFSLREELQERSGQEFPELSMGMSADFIPAIEEGATIIRIGSALFGKRIYL